MCEPATNQNIANFTHRHSIYKKNEIACVVDDERMTWKQFEGKISRIATGLKEMGVNKGDKVGSVLVNGWPILGTSNFHI